MKVLLAQFDGSIPNLALMRIAGHHLSKGHDVELRQVRSIQSAERGLWDDFDIAYGSLIFKKSRPIAERFQQCFPFCLLGGTGWDESITLESKGIDAPPDYSLWPNYQHSIGFTQRGCRLKCSFCVVPKKEGAVSDTSSIEAIWRGPPWPKNLLLLDNDFFGQPRWREKIDAIKRGNFKVNWNQGFNVRLIDDECAAAIADTPYYNGDFDTRRLYTAWDNRKDEHRLFRNLQSLVRYGVKPDHIMVYMLVAYWDGPRITADDHYRLEKLREFGCRPYPMPFVRNAETRGFQRWVVGAYDKRVKWDDFVKARYEPRNLRIPPQHDIHWAEDGNNADLGN